MDKRLEEAVDRIFRRLAATYGAAWDRSMGSAPMDDVKRVWVEDLAGFAHQLGLVAWALENLPERVPNVIEFRALCRRAPLHDAPRLTEPQANPERIQVELDRLRDLRKKAGASSFRDWARRIVARYEAGENITRAQLTMAQDAIRA